MKKILAVLLSVSMIMTLAACGGKETPNNSDNNTSTSTSVSVDNNTSVSVDDTNTSTEAPETNGDSFGSKVLASFTKALESGATLEAAMNKVAEENEDFGLCANSLEAGYMPGFTADVTGFAHAYLVNPFIATIPFVFYAFELDSTDQAALDAFLENLKSLADPRWNICTEAEEILFGTKNGYVYYGMFPGADF